MKRKSVLLVCLGLASSGAVALASAPRRVQSAHQAAFYTLNLKSTSVGKILVNTSGSILYMFTRDRSKKDSCVAIKACTAHWYPMASTGHDTGGPGVRHSLISTIALPKSYGFRQITYAGHPLYVFTSAATRVSYVGTSADGGHWDALNAKGKAVK